MDLVTTLKCGIHYLLIWIQNGLDVDLKWSFKAFKNTAGISKIENIKNGPINEPHQA